MATSLARVDERRQISRMISQKRPHSHRQRRKRGRKHSLRARAPGQRIRQRSSRWPRGYEARRTVADLGSLRVRDFIRVLGVLDDCSCRTRAARERIRRAVVRRFPVLEGTRDSSPFGPLAFTFERDPRTAALDICFSESLRRSGLRVPGDVRLELMRPSRSP